MLNFHLELAQLWHCPVEWCAVWKGSVRGCLDHLTDKHGGSTFFAPENVVKCFSPWTVTRDVWQTVVRPDVSGIAVDARLFHEAGCRLVHRYCVYKDPFPHSYVGGAAWPGTSRLLSRWRSVAGPAEFASCVIRRGCYGVGDAPLPACSPEGGTQTLLGCCAFVAIVADCSR